MFMRIFVIFLCVNNVCFSASPKETQTIKFKKVECSVSGITASQNECYVKAVSRQVSTLNFNFTCQRPLYKIMINLTAAYKYITTYRQVLNVPVIDVCRIVDGSKTNLLLSMIIKIFVDAGYAHIIHVCPYSEMVVYNFSQSGASYYNMFPSGDYRVSMLLFDDDDPKILKIVFDMNIKSPIKSSF